MYTEQEREEIYNYIVDKLKQREEVLSIIQIGSGAVGYRDKYSDLDFAVVVDDGNINDIFNKTKNDIQEKYNIYILDDMYERNLQVYLLDNYLEIDIGYYTLDNIYAKRENFKVVYDKTNKVENIMNKSWEELKEKNRGTSYEVDMSKVITFIDNELWYNVFHSIVAYKRNNKYRCYYELEQIKSYVIDLLAKRNNKESKRYRSLNELDKSSLNIIDYLFIYPNNYEELITYLKIAIEVIFKEFNYWKSKENINYVTDIDFYLKFIEENK